MTQKDLFDRFTGKDNYGRPRKDYLQRILDKDDKQLQEECEKVIWLSSYAANNPRSDYHWHVDICYAVCDLNGKTDIYKRAYKEIEKQVLE